MGRGIWIFYKQNKIKSWYNNRSVREIKFVRECKLRGAIKIVSFRLKNE